jgi:hypothetical protein
LKSLGFLSVTFGREVTTRPATAQRTDNLLPEKRDDIGDRRQDDAPPGERLRVGNQLLSEQCDGFMQKMMAKLPALLIPPPLVGPAPRGVQKPAGSATVSALQNALKKAGCDPGTVDGTFGEKTATALSKCPTGGQILAAITAKPH